MARKATSIKTAELAKPGYKLVWFEVENFKSVKKLRVDFRPFMVFVGPNGAGKTNVLQALGLLLEMIEDTTLSPLGKYGGFDQLVHRSARRSTFIRLALQFAVDERGKSRTLTVEVRLRGDRRGNVAADQSVTLATSSEDWVALEWADGEPGPLQSRGKHPRVLMDRLELLRSVWDPHGVFAQQVAQVCGFQSIRSAIRLRLDASALRSDVAGGVPQGGLLGISGDGLPRAVERVHGTPAFKQILTGLQAVYPRIEGVDTVQLLPGEVALRFKERAIKDGLGQANVSDGVMHALALLLVLEASEPGSTLLIEEPENALHPWALRTILRRVQESPRAGPLLLATHSPTFIDAVEDPASLFIVENDDKKGTVVTPALTREKALRAILAESGQKLGEVWLGGLLGGVPDGDA